MKYEASVIIAGAGLAGLSSALYLRELSPHLNILVLDKGAPDEASSSMAKGGLAAESSDYEAHIQDTIAAGAGKNNPEKVREFCGRAHTALQTLKRWGVQFDNDLHLEGGHSKRRIHHISDATGKYIMQSLRKKVNSTECIKIIEHINITDLLTDETGTCIGVKTTKNRSTAHIYAPYVIFAGGGAGRLYFVTTNGRHARGELIGLAKYKGAPLKDLAFIQFHPTLLNVPVPRPVLITEALRGEGAVLVNGREERFMPGYHPLAELAPRDAVARAIFDQSRKHPASQVFIDARHLSPRDWIKKFGNLYRTLSAAGIDPAIELIPVRAGAHYLCGGIVTDDHGRTGINNLYAAGECAYTGFHGANRLASNSLTEAVLTGENCARHIAALNPGGTFSGDLEALSKPPLPAPIVELPQIQVLRDMMEEKAGIVKTTRGLKEARTLIKHWILDETKPSPLKYSLITALEIVEDSIRQKENAGVFYNEDLLREEVV